MNNSDNLITISCFGILLASSKFSQRQLYMKIYSWVIWANQKRWNNFDNLLEYFLAPRVSEEDLPSLLTDVNVRRTLSCQSLVKSQLRYLTQVWSPNQFLLKAKIERVQRRATRWILQTRVDELFSKERLVTLNLLPLALDRELKDLAFY